MEESWLCRNGTRDQTEAQARVASWSRWTSRLDGLSERQPRGKYFYPGTHPPTHSSKHWRKKVYPGQLRKHSCLYYSRPKHWSKRDTTGREGAKQSSSTALFMVLSYPLTLQK